MAPLPLQPLRVVACTALIAATLPASAHSQVGVTTDILTGIVVDAQGNPLAGVVVEALSLESEITRRTTTDSHGRYTILFPDGGGQYRITARMIGMTPRLATVIRHADEDRLVWDVQMASAAFALDPVVITGGVGTEQLRAQTFVPPSPSPLREKYG